MKLRFALINIQGLVSKRQNKLKSQELVAIFRNNDIVLIMESWFNEHLDSNSNEFEHFALHRLKKKKNSKRDSGCIILYIRNEYVNDKTLLYQSKDDLLWIRNDGHKVKLENDLFIGL